MSAENIVTRAGRDVEPQTEPVEQAGFRIPADLRRQYEVRIIPGADSTDRRIGLFLPGDRDNPSIEILGNGDRIVARCQDPETVAALVTIARHNGWEGIDVDGSPEFRKAVWAAGTREGLAVRGYEPTFEELAKMDALRREDAGRRERDAARTVPPAEQVPPVSEPDPAVRPGDAERSGAPAGGREVSVELSSDDERLLLTLSAYTQDRKTLAENVRDDMSPVERALQSERLSANGEALGEALNRVLESETLVAAFSRAGHEPNDLRRLASADAWDGEIADAIDLLRSGPNRHEMRQEVPASDVQANRAYRDDAEARIATERGPAPETPDGRDDGRPIDTERRHEGDVLADLFMHGTAERIAAEPRLANALEVQSVMERHLGEVFDGDVGQTTAAALESRQMISDVLRRGLDVSVREPTPVRHIEPAPITPDLER
ncbi:hypothetical protein QE385_004002 [Sphingomonas sp. SORGH_AS 950]|uniref:LPD7 domain-containing protein n=1 Tax=Sphingomonas sp. SORGH_AS_0950 TaxID=3041792 RepID=UPI00278B6695|nr:LPD7 domain-containing protein [Sphingomonas sp. SORGH_AS_0950]MDQ1159605.1 hypothetical protein [Sphingomonas sp. SORGH_AS_0950]